MAVLYRHIRLDSNQPFYIGIGKTEKRAYDKHKRNNHWNNIVQKHGYKVQIMLDDLSWEEACEKEREFIQLYGRKDLGKGGLVNLTDGGDGAFGAIISEETKAKLSAALIGRTLSEDWKANVSKGLRGKPKSEEHKANMRKAAKLRWESRAGLQKRAEMSELLTNYYKSINN